VSKDGSGNENGDGGTLPDTPRAAISASPGSEGTEPKLGVKAGIETSEACCGTNGIVLGDRCASASLGSLFADSDDGIDGAEAPNRGSLVSKCGVVRGMLIEDSVTAGAAACPGRAWKNSFANCVNMATSESILEEARLLSSVSVSSAE